MMMKKSRQIRTAIISQLLPGGNERKSTNGTIFDSRTGNKTEDAHEDSSSSDVDVLGEDTFVKRLVCMRSTKLLIKLTRNIVAEREGAGYHDRYNKPPRI